MRVLKRYSNGAVRCRFEGVEFDVAPDGAIGYMSDWGAALEWERRTILTSRCYGPAAYNHVTYFIGGCYASVLEG